MFLGIDFGTTNSVCAIVEEGKPKVLRIDKGGESETLQSVLYVNREHQFLVGQSAIDKYLWDMENLPATPPERVATGRIIRIIKDSTPAGGFGGVEDVEEIIEVDTSGRGRLLQSLKTVLANSYYRGTEIFNQEYSLEELLSVLLKELKQRSEKIVGKRIDKAVIGRPVRYVGKYPDEKLAIKRMESIAQRAGFSEIKLEYEPVGAALNFGVNIERDLVVLVFDFGGGTLDTCVMKLPEKKIMAVSGRPIGGDLLSTEIFKNKLLHYFGSKVTFNEGRSGMPRHLMTSLENWHTIAQLKKKQNIDMLEYLINNADDPGPVKNLRELILSDSGFKIYQKIDGAKVRLSEKDRAAVVFEGNSFGINEEIIRVEFERMIDSYLGQTKDLLDEVIEMAGIEKDKIDLVITTGGSSNIPVFKKLLIEYFSSNKVLFGESFTSVAAGLALRADQVFENRKY